MFQADWNHSAHKAIWLGIALFVLAACGTNQTGDNATSSPAGQKPVPVYKVGQPYQIGGVWYYPKEDYSYDETGIASWYGAAFHNQTTANGEVFNKGELTAAHRTLPLPSLARVTNLDNGRSIVVRVNDRGPFSSGRIIDVSQRAAQLLGFEGVGTAKVRVQVLADESKAIADAMRHYGTTPTQELAMNAAPVSSVTSQQLQPPASATAPISKVEADEIMSTIKPVPEVKQMPVTGPNQIYVQAGAFTVLENATKLQQQLASLGNAQVLDTIIKGTKFYRVRVGPIADVPQADSLLQKVIHAGVSHPRIVVD